MRQALAATRDALHHFAVACRSLQRLSHPFATRQVALNLRRLEAMEADLQKRIRPKATADALYTDLVQLHAGLVSLAESAGRLKEAYRSTLPVTPPAEGWFLDEAEPPATTKAPAEALDPSPAADQGWAIDGSEREAAGP